MKTLKYIFLALIASWLMASCTDDQSSDAKFASDELPKIFLSNWSGTIAVNVGEDIKFSPLVSPSDGANFKWTLGGKTIATTLDLLYKVTEAGEFELKFEVERNGIKSHRVATLVGLVPFIPKTSNKKVVAFLDAQTAAIADIQWNHITHIVWASSVVQEDGSVLYNLDNANQDLENLIKVAHNYGVYVLLDIAGAHISLNAVPMWGSYNFYNVAIDPVKRIALIKDILKTAEENLFDGINIYFDKAHDGAFAKPQDVREFFVQLAEMAPEKSANNDQKFLLSMSLPVGWTKDGIGASVGIARYDWYNVYAFAMEDLTPGPHSSVWAFTDNTAHWVTMYSVPAEKMVPTVPALALKYDLKGNTPTWGDIHLYTSYITYSDLVREYPDAAQSNSLSVADGIFYDGIPAINEKAAAVHASGYGGMGLWKADFDTKDAAKSLTKAIDNALNNN